MGGFTVVGVIGRKVPAAKFGRAPGVLNCGWLNALKNSARNWSVWFSRILVVFRIEISKLNCPAPFMMPVPEWPNIGPQAIPGFAAAHCACPELPGTESETVPVGDIAGGAMKAALLN